MLAVNTDLLRDEAVNPSSPTDSEVTIIEHYLLSAEISAKRKFNISRWLSLWSANRLHNLVNA